MVQGRFLTTGLRPLGGRNDRIISTGPGRLHFIPAAAALRDRGEAVRLITGWVAPGWLARVWPRLGVRVMPAGISYRACAMAELLTQVAVRLTRWLPANARGAVEAAGWRLFGWASRRHIRDAAVFHVRSGAGRGGAIAKARRQGMLVVVDHSIVHPGFMAEKLGKEYSVSNLFWRQVLEDCDDADVVLVNSEFVRDTFIAQGFPRSKLHVAYLGVEPEYWKIRRKVASSGPLQLLFVGAFGLRKGAEQLLDAMEKLREAGVGVSLEVVGSVLPGYRRQIEGVTYHGLVSGERVREFLKTADVFVLPTLAEGCARAVMEALAAGVCVVTTRESGAPVVDGETGFLIPAGDSGALAERLRWLAVNRSVVESVAKAGALAAQQYSWERYSAEILAVIQ